MISTVTTTTVTTITSYSVISSLAFIAVIVFMVLLVQKEIMSVSEEKRWHAWGRVINIALIPLLLSFIFIAVVMINEVIQ